MATTLLGDVPNDLLHLHGQAPSAGWWARRWRAGEPTKSATEALQAILSVAAPPCALFSARTAGRQSSPVTRSGKTSIDSPGPRCCHRLFFCAWLLLHMIMITYRPGVAMANEGQH